MIYVMNTVKLYIMTKSQGVHDCVSYIFAFLFRLLFFAEQDIRIDPQLLGFFSGNADRIPEHFFEIVRIRPLCFNRDEIPGDPKEALIIFPAAFQLVKELGIGCIVDRGCFRIQEYDFPVPYDRR